MPEELKLLREAAEARRGKVDLDKWCSKPKLWDYRHFRTQPISIPESVDPNLDKNINIKNIYMVDQLQGHIVHLQNKLNEHIDRHKKRGAKYK